MPAVQEKHSKGFSKTRAQARMVELENQSLQQLLLKRRTTSSIRSNRSQNNDEKDVLTLLEKRLKGISVNMKQRDNQRELEDTLELWE